MSVDRITVTLDAELGRSVREAASESGMSVSAWLSEAAADLLRNHFLGVAIEAYEAEHGVITDEELAEARRILNGEYEEEIVDPGAGNGTKNGVD